MSANGHPQAIRVFRDIAQQFWGAWVVARHGDWFQLGPRLSC